MRYLQEREGNIHDRSLDLKSMINEYISLIGMNWLQQDSWSPSQHQHPNLQKNYTTDDLNFELDWTAFSEHSTLHQRQIITNTFLIRIGCFGIVVVKDDWFPTNEETITLCVEWKIRTGCFVV